MQTIRARPQTTKECGEALDKVKDQLVQDLLLCDPTLDLEAVKEVRELLT